MAIYPRMYIRGLNVQTYNSTFDAPSATFHDIVTSQYNTETKKFISLGTVFAVANRGYDFIVDKEGDYAEATANRWVGASRLLFYPSTANEHPQQIEALVGFQYGDNGGIRPVWWSGHYPTPETYKTTSGLLGFETPDLAPYSYFTFVYNKQTLIQLELMHSVNPTFTADSTSKYPVAIATVLDYNTVDKRPWVVSYCECIPVDVIVPLPGYAVTVTQRGATGIIVGAELQDPSGNVVEDISTRVQYSIEGTDNASLDANRQLIIANQGELPANFEIKITWDNMPYEPHNILVTVDIDDDTGGGGDGGGGDDDDDVTEIDISIQLGLAIGLGLEGWAARGDASV